MSRAIDLIITYRVVKMLVTPFNKFKAYDLGIIDEKGKSLKKMKEVKGSDRKHYTMLHRFVFNLKRILQKVGLGSRLGSFAVALALLIKEDKSYAEHKDAIESAVITYLKEENLYNMLLNEVREMPEIEEEPYMTCFGMGVYEKNGELVSEDNYAKTL
jgi:DNA polymerase elongation subunit (family B)